MLTFEFVAAIQELMIANKRYRQARFKFRKYEGLNNFVLTITAIGEHLDDPRHHYYRPDVEIVHASLPNEQVIEMRQILQRML